MRVDLARNTVSMAVQATEGSGGVGASARCDLYRYDVDDLPLPWTCGRAADHADPGPGCGDWLADVTRCPACGRTESEHLRDLMRFDPACTAWPPADD